MKLELAAGRVLLLSSLLSGLDRIGILLKSYFLPAVLVGLCSISCAQNGQAETEPLSTDQQAVHAAVDQIVAAIDRNDADAFERLTTPDYTFVNPAGKVLNKAQYLGLIRSGTLKLESYSRDEETIRIYGNTAVVIYRSTPKGTFKDQELTSQRRVTTVLIKQDGRWLATGRQSTPILTLPPK